MSLQFWNWLKGRIITAWVPERYHGGEISGITPSILPIIWKPKTKVPIESPRPKGNQVLSNSCSWDFQVLYFWLVNINNGYDITLHRVLTLTTESCGRSTWGWKCRSAWGSSPRMLAPGSQSQSPAPRAAITARNQPFVFIQLNLSIACPKVTSSEVMSASSSRTSLNRCN